MSKTKQCHALLCFGVFGRYATNCYPNAQYVGATKSGKLTLPYCPGFPYMGHKYSTRDKNRDNEIQRSTTAWTAFAKHRDIFKGDTGKCLKRQVYNSCVLPAMTYGAETWALSKTKQAAAQTKMERRLGYRHISR